MERLILKKLISDVRFDELDFVLNKKFNIDSDNDEYIEFIHRGRGSADGYPIDIDTLINELIDMKHKRATHIEIDYNEDHIGYTISAFEIRLPDEETIEEVKNHEKKKLRLQKESKIKHLEAEIKRLKSEDI